MANMTAREQLMLELVNRARMDPRGEAARLDVVLGSGEGKPVPVLAGNDALRAAAYNHSGWMLLNDSFTRDEDKDSQSFIAVTPLDRMKAYGYALSGSYAYAENISWQGNVDVPDFTQLIAVQHEDLFASAAARARMLDTAYQEAGIGQQAGDFEQDGETFVTSIVTQDFIASGAKVFITGVIYDDKVVANDVYDVGEGVASRKVTAGEVTDKAGPGGGYELQFTASGIETLTFDLKGPDLTLDVALGSTNVKVDVVDRTEIWTNASVQSQSAAITELHALGVSDLVLIGSDVAEVITGNRAANQLLGQGGADFIKGYKGKDTLMGGVGPDTLAGGAGADTFVYTARKESKAAAPDTIVKFDDGRDRIDLSGLIEGKFKYRGETPITGAHEVGVSESGKHVIVHINLDADAADEMTILLTGTHLSAMSKGDFIL
jgi:Ca2+-binding RTX toxin-like protein